MTQKIFVYGSLRTGMYNYDIYLKDRIVQSELAYVLGSLYTIHNASYPALLKGTDFIAGEIMEIEDAAILKQLDDLEGWMGEGNIHNEYHKVLTKIYDDKGVQIDELPVYFFNLDNPAHQNSIDALIKEHDYVKYIYQQERKEAK